MSLSSSVDAAPPSAPPTAAASRCRGEAQCMEVLKAATGIADIDASVFAHAELTSMEEGMAEFAKRGIATEKLVFAKNMFLKGKKGELVLVFALASTKTDLKKVNKAIGSAALRFAPADVLEESLGVVQGAVTPLALVNDTSKAVVVVLDKALLDCSPSSASDDCSTAKDGEPLVAVHPCRNDKTILLTVPQINSFIKARGNRTVVVDFGAEL